jgi:chaperonin GroES
VNVKLRPRSGKILVLEDAFKYEGVIVVPDKAKRRPTTGVIVKVGKNAGDDNEFKEGDHILYAQFSGTGIKVAGQPEYRVLSPDEVLLFLDADVIVEEVSA